MQERQWLAAAFASITLITLISLGYLHHGMFDLFVDEAQYWSWAQQPAFGYYSKPPMVAWLIMLTSSLCGESEFCLRLSSPLLHAMTALMIYGIAQCLYTPKIAFWSALIYITMPAVIVSSGIISTDPPLLFFWSASLYCFIQAVRQPEIMRWWIATSITLGLGILSKYNMLIFVPSALLFLLVSRQHSLRLLKNYRLYLAALLTALIYLPNFLWNMEHHFVSYAHTSEISGLGKSLFHPQALLNFIGAQAGVFGPLLFGLLLWIFYKALRRPTEMTEETRLLLCFTVPFFAVISALSFLSKAQPNWAAPMYVAASILVVAYSVQRRSMVIIYASILLHILVGALYYNYNAIQAYRGIQTYARTGSILNRDPFARVKGWNELAQRVTPLLAHYPNAVLLCDEREPLTELLYYIRPHPFTIRKWPARPGIIKDHFDLTRPIDLSPTDGRPQEYLLITRYGNDTIPHVHTLFREVTQLPEIVVPLYPDYQLRYFAYHIKR